MNLYSHAKIRTELQMGGLHVNLKHEGGWVGERVGEAGGHTAGLSMFMCKLGLNIDLQLFA